MIGFGIVSLNMRIEEKLKKAKVNELKGVNRFSYLEVGAYICTGTQSPHYSKRLHGEDVVKVLINEGTTGLKQLLVDKQNELNSIFSL